MSLVQIPAKDTLVNLQKDPKLYYIIVVGALLTVLIFALTQNIVTVMFFVFATFALFFLLNKPPQDVLINLSQKGLESDLFDIEWFSIDSWVAGEQDGWLEITLKTTVFTKPYILFYIPNNHPQTQSFLTYLSERVTYDQGISKQNWVHNLMQKLGLR